MKKSTAFLMTAAAFAAGAYAGFCAFAAKNEFKKNAARADIDDDSPISELEALDGVKGDEIYQ